MGAFSPAATQKDEELSPSKDVTVTTEIYSDSQVSSVALPTSSPDAVSLSAPASVSSDAASASSGVGGKERAPPGAASASSVVGGKKRAPPKRQSFSACRKMKFFFVETGKKIRLLFR